MSVQYVKVWQWIRRHAVHEAMEDCRHRWVELDYTADEPLTVGVEACLLCGDILPIRTPLRLPAVAAEAMQLIEVG